MGGKTVAQQGAVEMKALVTGGGGFLGRGIVNRLLKEGHEVRVLGRRDYPDLRLKGVELVRTDISNKEAVMTACSCVDIVFHVAAITSIWGKRENFYNANVIGTRNIIEGCIKSGIKKLVYTSSPSVAFDAANHLEMDETAPYPDKYLAFYPETKAIAEKEVLEANGKESLMTVALRPHLIWGPGDTNLIPRLINRARKGKVRIVGDGGNLIDTVFIDNAVDAHMLAADKLVEGSPVCGSAYFITNGEPVNCWNWINSLLEGFNIPPITNRVSFKAAYRAGFVLETIYRWLDLRSEPRMTRFLAAQLATDHTYSIEKAKKELGYNPKISIEEGMKELFRSHSTG